MHETETRERHLIQVRCQHILHSRSHLRTLFFLYCFRPSGRGPALPRSWSTAKNSYSKSNRGSKQQDKKYLIVEEGVVGMVVVSNSIVGQIVKLLRCKVQGFPRLGPS